MARAPSPADLGLSEPVRRSSSPEDLGLTVPGDNNRAAERLAVNQAVSNIPVVGPALSMMRIGNSIIQRGQERDAELQEEARRYYEENTFWDRWGQRLDEGWTSTKSGLNAWTMTYASDTLGKFDEVDRGTYSYGVMDQIADAFVPSISDRMAQDYAEASPEERLEMRLRLGGLRDDATTKLVKAQAHLQQIPKNPYAMELAGAKTFGDVGQAFVDAGPSEIPGLIAQLGIPSLVSGAPGIVAGVMSKNPAVAATLMGIGAGQQEYGPALVEAMGREGVNVMDENEIAAAMSDPELVARVKEYALTRAGVVGTGAVVAGGLARVRLGSSFTADVASQLGLQPVVDMGFEGLAQLAAAGEIEPGQLVAEGLGGLATAPAEVAAMRLNKPGAGAAENGPGDVGLPQSGVDGPQMPQMGNVVGLPAADGSVSPVSVVGYSDDGRLVTVRDRDTGEESILRADELARDAVAPPPEPEAQGDLSPDELADIAEFGQPPEFEPPPPPKPKTENMPGMAEMEQSIIRARALRALAENPDYPPDMQAEMLAEAISIEKSVEAKSESSGRPVERAPRDPQMGELGDRLPDQSRQTDAAAAPQQRGATGQQLGPLGERAEQGLPPPTAIGLEAVRTRPPEAKPKKEPPTVDRFVRDMSKDRNQSLKPEAVASRYGITRDQATSLMHNAAAADKTIQVRQRNGKQFFARTPMYNGPEDVITFIRRAGGIEPTAETRAMDLHKHNQKNRRGYGGERTLGPLVRGKDKGGKTIHEIREKLEENKVIPPGTEDDVVMRFIRDALIAERPEMSAGLFSGTELEKMPTQSDSTLRTDLEREADVIGVQNVENMDDASLEMAIYDAREIRESLTQDAARLGVRVSDTMTNEEIQGDIDETLAIMGEANPDAIEMEIDDVLNEGEFAGWARDADPDGDFASTDEINQTLAEASPTGERAVAQRQSTEAGEGADQTTGNRADSQGGVDPFALDVRKDEAPTYETIDTLDGPRDQAVMPGMEQAVEQAEAKKKAEDRLYVEAKKREKKLKGKVPQLGAESGGLFDTQQQLFNRQEIVLNDVQSVEIENTPEGMEKLDKATAAVNVALAKVLGPGNPEVQVISKIRDSRVLSKDAKIAGILDEARNLILVAFHDSPDHIATGRHEGVHMLRRAGLFTDPEWSALEGKADKEWVDQFDVRALYEGQNLTEEQIREEAIAKAYPAWARGELKPDGVIDAAFQKLAELFARLRAALAGEGFYSVNDVFSAIERGEVGARVKDAPGYSLADQNGKLSLRDPSGQEVGVFDDREQATEFAGELAQTIQSENAYAQSYGQDFEAQIQEEARVKGKDNVINKLSVERAPAPMGDQVAWLSAIGRYIKFPRGLAAIDGISARYYDAVDKVDKLRSSLQAKYAQQYKSTAALSETDRESVYALEELDRLNKTQRQDNGRSLVARNNDTADARLSEPGQIIELSPEASKVYFDRRRMFQSFWQDFITGALRRHGYYGEPTRQGIANYINQGLAESDNGKLRTGTYAMQLFEALKAQERDAYVPFSRHGDHFVSVRRNVPDEFEGRPGLAWFELVDTSTAMDKVVTKVRKRGEKVSAVDKKIAELKEKYPESEYTITYGPVTPKELESLPVSTFARLVMAMSQDKVAEYTPLINELYDTLRKEQLAGWKQEANNVPGWDTDFTRSTVDYLRNGAHNIARLHYANEVENAFDATQRHPSHRVRDFWKSHKDRMESTVSDMAGVRKFGFLWFLGGTPAAAIINSTQSWLVAQPMIGTWAGQGRAALKYNEAWLETAAKTIRPGDTVINVRLENLGRTDGERAMIKKLERNGTLNAQITKEFAGGNTNVNPTLRKYQRFTEQAFDILASMFGAVEIHGRAATALATYRMAQDPALLQKAREVYKENSLFKQYDALEGGMTPERLAEFMVDETWFRAGKINRQPIATGPGAAILQFRNFSMNYYRLQHQAMTRMGPQGKMAAFLMLATIVAAAGLKGFPFAEDVKQAGEWAQKLVTSIDRDFDEELRDMMTNNAFSDWLADNFDIDQAATAETALHGLSRQLTGVDVGQRLGQGNFLPDGRGLDFLGPAVGGTASRALQAADRFKGGDYKEGTAALLPKFASDMYRAVEVMPTQGVTTTKGSEIIAPDEVTSRQRVWRALGFASAEEARERGKIWAAQRADRAADMYIRDKALRIARALRFEQLARERGDWGEASQWLTKRNDEVASYREFVTSSETPDYLKRALSEDAVKNALIRIQRPDLWAIMRAPPAARPAVKEIMDRGR